MAQKICHIVKSSGAPPEKGHNAEYLDLVKKYAQVGPDGMMWRLTLNFYQSKQGQGKNKRVFPPHTTLKHNKRERKQQHTNDVLMFMFACSLESILYKVVQGFPFTQTSMQMGTRPTLLDSERLH